MLLEKHILESELLLRDTKLRNFDYSISRKIGAHLSIKICECSFARIDHKFNVPTKEHYDHTWLLKFNM